MKCQKLYNFFKGNIFKFVIIPLIVALIGVSPFIYKHFFKVDLHIDFQEEQSMCAFIESESENKNGKLVILLYRISLVGKGSESVFIKKIDLFIKCREEWFKGNRYAPKKYKPHNQVHLLRQIAPNNWRKFILVGWGEFKASNHWATVSQKHFLMLNILT